MYALEEVIPKTERSLFGIEKFIKQLPKGGKLNDIVLDKSNQKDMVTDEVEVPNYVIRVWLRTHHNFFSLVKQTLEKNKKLIIIVHF